MDTLMCISHTDIITSNGAVLIYCKSVTFQNSDNEVLHCSFVFQQPLKLGLIVTTLNTSLFT
jgi:hypothetical protein